MKSSAGHSDPDVKTLRVKKNLHRGTKPKKKENPRQSFNSTMAEALIKSGHK
jgi:hypothetical protein